MTLLKLAADSMARAEVERPQWTAEQLLAHRLGCRPIDLYLNSPSAAANANLRPSLRGREAPEAISFQADVAARMSGVPLQYLLRSASFYGREFIVGPGVFIPRPETEILIDVALAFLRGHPRTPPPRVVDVGTGCGAIAITLALECPGVRLCATDRSSLALSFSRRNAVRYQVPIPFLQGDLLDSFLPRSVDLVLANLPYLEPESSSGWPRELAWEPWMALSGGRGGTCLIRRFLRTARSLLKPGGRLLLEIAPDQCSGLALFAEGIGFQVDPVVRDLAGKQRLLVLE